MKRVRLLAISFVLSGLPVVAVAAEEGGGGHGAEFRLFIFSVINFILFVALLFILLRKPVTEFLRERRKRVSTEIEDASRLLEEAQKRHEEMKTRLDRLDAEMAEIKEQLRKEGEMQGERTVERSEQLIARVREDAKFQAEQLVKMAREELQAEAARLAVGAAEEILKKSVNEKDHDRLVGRFLKEVKEQ